MLVAAQQREHQLARDHQRHRGRSLPDRLPLLLAELSRATRLCHQSRGTGLRATTSTSRNAPRITRTATTDQPWPLKSGLPGALPGILALVVTVPPPGCCTLSVIVEPAVAFVV